MTDEYKVRQAAARGVRAKELAEDELLKEALDGLERSYTEWWSNTKPEDEKAREKCYLAVNVVRKVRAHLAQVMANGRLAEAELRQLSEDAERKKIFGII